MYERDPVFESPAKVNLYLDVDGKRPDGYHDIRSVIIPISLHDRVTITEQESGVCTEVVSDHLPPEHFESIGTSDDNLATKAYHLFSQETGIKRGAKIHIDKAIPVGGGLGGGSGNAAAVLRGLNEMWNVGMSDAEIASIARPIGCDVPAMILNRAVTATGLGEIVDPIPISASAEGDGWWLVVVNPGFCVSTGDIYARYTSPLTSDPRLFKCMVSAVSEGDLDAAVNGLFNSLESVALRKYPLLAIVAERLREAGALGVLLCGSGSSMFAIARNESHAHAIDAHIGESKDLPLWHRVARTLPDGVMVAHGPLEA